MSNSRRLLVAMRGWFGFVVLLLTILVIGWRAGWALPLFLLAGVLILPKAPKDEIYLTTLDEYGFYAGLAIIAGLTLYWLFTFQA